MTVRLTAALATLFAGAVLSTPVLAQARDSQAWGGPPNLGLDFGTGQSYGVSDFGANKTGPKKRRVVRARGGGKSAATGNASVLKDPPLPEPNPARLAGGDATTPATRTASTGEATGTATDAGPVETGTLAPAIIDTGPVPCRKYDPTTGRTIEVRCR